MPAYDSTVKRDRVLAMHEDGHGWREIARHFPEIPEGTIRTWVNRYANGNRRMQAGLPPREIERRIKALVEREADKGYRRVKVRHVKPWSLKARPEDLAA